MAITSDCGHHCGVRPNAEGTFTNEGHCDCAECHNGAASYYRELGSSRDFPARPPMCDRRAHVIRDGRLISWGPVLDPPWSQP